MAPSAQPGPGERRRRRHVTAPASIDNRGEVNRDGKMPDGTDVGFQLWDIAKRPHQPAAIETGR